MVSRANPLVSQDRSNPLANQETAKRILQTMFFIKNQDNKLVQSLLEKNQGWAETPEIMVWSILAGNVETANLLLQRGLSLEHPPVAVSPGYTQNPDVDSLLNNYKQTPYIIIAAIAGQIRILEFLVSNGRKITETGHIGYSKNKLNAVLGNVLSAAVYHDKIEVVNWLFRSFTSAEIGLESALSEEKSKGAKGSLNKEYFGFTPFLLAAQRCSLEILTVLVQNGADIKAIDWQRNTALHIAVKRNDPLIVEFLCKIPGFDLMATNQVGQTAFSLAKEKNLQQIDQILSTYIPDSSQQSAEELMDLLTKEEDKKAKKKQKKTRTQKVVIKEEIVEPPKEEKKKALKVVSLKDVAPPVKAKPQAEAPKLEESKVIEPVKGQKPTKAQPTQEEKKIVKPVEKPAEKSVEKSAEEVEVLQVLDKDAEIEKLRSKLDLYTGKADYSKLSQSEIQDLRSQLTQTLAKISNQ